MQWSVKLFFFSSPSFSKLLTPVRFTARGTDIIKKGPSFFLYSLLIRFGWPTKEKRREEGRDRIEWLKKGEREKKGGIRTSFGASSILCFVSNLFAWTPHFFIERYLSMWARIDGYERERLLAWQAKLNEQVKTPIRLGSWEGWMDSCRRDG